MHTHTHTHTHTPNQTNKPRESNITVVGSQIVAHTQMETGDGPNKPNTINL